MLLACDIGNTNIVLGVLEGQNVLHEFRLRTDLRRTLDEYTSIVMGLLERKLGPKLSFSEVIVCSVVPQVTADFCSFVRDQLNLTPVIIGPGTKTGLVIRVADPASVGADRIVNSVAAKAFYTAPVLVVDFGTATSFDYINSSGEYEGGVIAPGVRTALEALVTNTAKLPRIELSWPTKVIGKTTVSAMQSGAVRGYLALVDGLVAQIEAEVGMPLKVVATGGLGDLFSKHSLKISEYVPHLTLKGIALIAAGL